VVKKSFSDKEIELLFPRYALSAIGWKNGSDEASVNARKKAYAKISAVCKKYNFWPLESHRYIKDRLATICSSTEDYPIFAWIEEDNGQTFAKIYEPKHFDKSKRFKYAGARPKDFVHGL